MKSRSLLCAALLLTLFCTLTTRAQEKGYWRASSSNARSITGDVAFSEYKIAINFSSYTIAQIRTLQPAEARALFNPDDPTAGAGNLYRLNIPADKRFLHHNTLCGAQETQWVITYVEGRNLQIALFAESSIPTLTPESLAVTTRLCGIFTYKR